MKGLKIPDQPVLMQTNRDYRLSSLNGYVVNFRAGQPCRVPPNAYLEAVSVGAVICDDQPEVEPEEITERPSIAETAKLEAEAKLGYIQQACLKVMAENDTSLLKTDGSPKVIAVISALEPQAPRPSAAEIQQVWDLMQRDMDLAED